MKVYSCAVISSIKPSLKASFMFSAKIGKVVELLLPSGHKLVIIFLSTAACGITFDSNALFLLQCCVTM